MSSIDAAEAVTRLQNLSPERASKVLSLIDDLVELEALEDAADLKDAREALKEIKTAVSRDDKPTVPYADIRRESGLER